MKGTEGEWFIVGCISMVVATLSAMYINQTYGTFIMLGSLFCFFIGHKKYLKKKRKE